MLFVIIWWVVDARKWFKGPKVGLALSSFHFSLDANQSATQVNVEHQMLGREGNVIDGKDGDSSSDGMTKEFDDSKAAKLA